MGYCCDVTMCERADDLLVVLEWKGVGAGLGRRCLLIVLLAVIASVAPVASVAYSADLTKTSSLLAAAELRVGVERLAKLHFEQRTSGQPARAIAEHRRERDRVLTALAVLRNDKALAAVPRNRLGAVNDAVDEFVDGMRVESADTLQIYRDSEALAIRISFVGLAVASLHDNEQAQLQDLVTRAAATALRVGKIHFASVAGVNAPALRVDIAQALIEFDSALQAINSRQLDEGTRSELLLAQHQWVLLRSAIDARGSLRDRARARDVATTTDRIAESLLAAGRRNLRARQP